MHVARRGAEFGFTAGDVRADMARVKARKDAIVRQSTTGIEQWMKGTERVTVYEGHGRFTGPRTVSVNDAVLEAPEIFINVGARAMVPGLDGIGEVPFLTNSTILDLDVLPEHLVVVGGSYIGLEFAQVFRRFGSRVTVVERGPRLIAREDEDVSAGVQAVLEREGIDVRLSATCVALARQPAGYGPRRLRGRTPEVEGAMLIAVGRRPNTDDLGSRPRAWTWTSGGTWSSTAVPHLRPRCLGAGRCSGHGAFTHTAYTTTRSSPPTCSTTTPAGSTTASPATPSIRTHRSDGRG